MTAAIEGGSYRSAPERRERIIEMLSVDGFRTISELSSALDVSEMTIRRDVDALTATGRVRRVHGGATLLPLEALHPSDFAERAADNSAAKQAVARGAISLLSPGMSICIDSGSTAYELARTLPTDLKLTIATHSLPVLNALMTLPQVRVHALGGELYPGTQDFAGPATVAAIGDLRISTLFLGGAGLSERGVFCVSDHEALVKRALIEVSDRVVLIADASKFDASAMVRVCDWSYIDVFVTDASLREEDRQAIPATVELLVTESTLGAVR